MHHRRVILVRYGEISLKGGNRRSFEDLLLARVRRALAPFPGAAGERRHGRLLVTAREQDWPGVTRALGRVFGVVSFSPALEVARDFEEIQAAALVVLDEAVRDRPGAGPAASVSFKVDSRRAEKSFPHTSPEISRLLGAYLLASRAGLRVDVHHPDVTVNVEVRERAYVFSESVPGPGGLPVGSAGKVHLLLSGGIDSPVAGWMAMKRGAALEAVHFHSPPFTGDRSREKVIELCRILSGWGGPVTLHVVHFTEAQKEIYEKCPAPLGVPLMRRMMVRIAQSLARSNGGLALVTGESLGQVASQTLESIAVIDAVAALPILRPLIGLDKAEIIEIARRIGTYDTSILPYEDCCALFVARHPRTRPSLGEVEQAEAALDVEALEAGALARTESLGLPQVSCGER